MNTKGFLLLIATAIVIGGSVGGAFAGGLALGRSQSNDASSGAALLHSGGPTASDGSPATGTGEPSSNQDNPAGLGGGTFGGRAGAGGVLAGTVGSVDGNTLTVTTGSGESQAILGDESVIQIYRTGTAEDLSSGDRVLVMAAGGLESGGAVAATLVTVNPPDGARTFGPGGTGGRGGFAGGASNLITVSGAIDSIDGNVFTVTTGSGETHVNLNDESVIQLYESGTAGDLSPGDSVLVVTSGDVESGDPVNAESVIVNPPQGAGAIGGGGFGGRPRNP